MDNMIMTQIQLLQELRSKCLDVYGYYCDIDTAMAALQICTPYGLDQTARFISDLRSHGISNNDDLRKLFSNSQKENEMIIIKTDSGYKCPNCNSNLEEYNTYCKHCGQHLKISSNGAVAI